MTSRYPALEPKQDRSVLTRNALLDAAVDELVEFGYPRLTTSSVAVRAGVSRGAQQNHFPHKATLVAEAVRHLGTRQVDELEAELVDVRGPGRPAKVLEILFRQYSGPLYAATIEAALAGRFEAELATLASETEAAVADVVHAAGETALGEGAMRSPAAARRWAVAVSAVRGLATLGVLGRDTALVERQWRSMKRELTSMLTEAG